MANLDTTWINIFNQIRHVCFVKGMTLPTTAWAITQSGETALVELPADGDAVLSSGRLNHDAVHIVVADPAEKLPFLFTKSAGGLLRWHRPAIHA